jgi:hypothetical protein
MPRWNSSLSKEKDSEIIKTVKSGQLSNMMIEEGRQGIHDPAGGTRHRMNRRFTRSVQAERLSGARDGNKG